MKLNELYTVQCFIKKKRHLLLNKIKEALDSETLYYMYNRRNLHSEGSKKEMMTGDVIGDFRLFRSTDVYIWRRTVCRGLYSFW